LQFFNEPLNQGSTGHTSLHLRHQFNILIAFRKTLLDPANLSSLPLLPNFSKIFRSILRVFVSMYSCRYAVCSSRLLIWNALTTAFFDLSSAASAPRHLATIFTVEHLTQLQSCRSFPRATIDSVSMASAIKCAKVFLQRPIYSLNAVQLTPHVNSYCQVYKNFLLIKVSFRVRCLSP